MEVPERKTEAEPPPELTTEARAACVEVLQQIADDPRLIQNDDRIKALVAKIHRKGKKGERHETRGGKIADDRRLRAQTAMARRGQENRPLAESDGAAGLLARASRCYVCKTPYTVLDAFYHLLCPACAAFNQNKRHQRANLSGRIALLTGGRIKMGFQLALRLLRDGARVLVTTRFPGDARRRFAQEPDYADWAVRLELFGLDLRNLPRVETFAQNLTQTLPHLDILINHAAQTIKRPLAFYRDLLDGEGDAAPVLLEAHARYPVLEGTPNDAIASYFPPGARDADGEQEDLRPVNSWVLPLGEVGALEAMEVHLVNAVAPLTLCDRLLPLLHASPHARRFIVNVSAIEGQFGQEHKTHRHPHTSMAKAALNMLTRTSAEHLARRGVYVNSVDTGWVSDQNPYPQREKFRDQYGFFAPLDAVDGAARIYDPIARGINEDGEPVWGQFLKDYVPHPW